MSILKEINTEYSLEGLMLKLKLQYFGHLMRRANSFEKTLMLGKIEGRRRRGQQGEMVGWYYQLNGHEFEQAPGNSEGQGGLVCCSPRGHKESGSTEQLNTQIINIRCSITRSCPTLCDPMNYSTPGFPVLHHLPELPQTHVH